MTRPSVISRAPGWRRQHIGGGNKWDNKAEVRHIKLMRLSDQLGLESGAKYPAYSKKGPVGAEGERSRV